MVTIPKKKKKKNKYKKTSTQSLSHVRVFFGLYFKNCISFIIGFPQPTYRWLKNGVPVGNFSSSQYLKILNITRDDAGSYQCEASNKAGTIFSEKIDVVVACKHML